MSRALLKLSGGSVHDYATISADSPSPNRASRARRAPHAPIRWVTVDGGLPPDLDVSDRTAMHQWLQRNQ